MTAPAQIDLRGILVRHGLVSASLPVAAGRIAKRHVDRRQIDDVVVRILVHLLRLQGVHRKTIRARLHDRGIGR